MGKRKLVVNFPPINESQKEYIRILEVMRRRPDYIRLKEERKWEQNLPVRSLFGARVTFLGTGDCQEMYDNQ